MVSRNNEEVASKLREEREKYDTLLAGRIEIDERFRVKAEKKTEDEAVAAAQELKLKELKELIEADEVLSSEQNLAIEEARKINKTEEERNRELNQRFAALTAQLSFIEENYDSKSAVKGVSLDVFKSVLETN
jgi:hypothetical protein